MQKRNMNAVRVWRCDSNWVTNLLKYQSPPPRPTKSRPRLTPAQRGRFWQSVVDTSAAAKATSSQGFKHGEVNHE